MRHLHRWPAPRWIRGWMILATRGGDGWLWYAMGILVVIFGGERRFAALAAGILAVGTGIVIQLRIKKLGGRPRPCSVEPHCWASLLPPDKFSFPSGHTITAFAATVVGGRFYPALLPSLLFCTLSIAASRILLGMHYLSDVIVGALLGTLLGFAAAGLFL